MTYFYLSNLNLRNLSKNLATYRKIKNRLFEKSARQLIILYSCRVSLLPAVVPHPAFKRYGHYLPAYETSDWI